MAMRLSVIKPTNHLSGHAQQQVELMFKQIGKACQQESEQHRRMFKRATSTWSAPNKPKFERKSGRTADTIFSRLTTDSKPFTYIELGTSKRYMHMTRDFIPKSTPRVLKSGPGHGGPAGLSWPTTGIEPRDYRIVISDQREKIFAAKIAAIVRTYMRKI